MENLYSYKGAYPYPLPKDMSGYDIKDFYLAPSKPETLPGQKLDWEGTNWVILPPNKADEEIQWASVRQKRDELLSYSDIYVIRSYEDNIPVPQETVDYRQSLRDVTKQQDPFNIVWPMSPPKPF